jgi:hypothetical protein
MGVHGLLDRIGNPLVDRQQDPTLLQRGGPMQIGNKIDRQVFVDLSQDMQRNQPFLMRQFGSISKRSLDVLRPQSRIASEDLFPRGALSQIIENHGDRNSSASGAKIACTNSGVAAEVLLPDRHVTIVSRRRAGEI